MASLVLTEQDFVDDAKKIGCSVAAIRAVAEVEGAGKGFDPEGFPKTLFEGHIFHRLTKGQFSSTHPTLSYPTWTKQFYGKTWQEEKQRLANAALLNHDAAMLSASWGLFQILGLNFALAGFSSVKDFVAAQCESANSQLATFTEFIIHSGLADELRDCRWADFARRYNGPSYALNKYDVKMAAAYKRLSSSTNN